MTTSDMTSEEKLQYVSLFLEKLMSVSEKAIKKQKYNLALSALSTYCEIQYSINQVYTDKKAERLLLHMAKEIVRIPADYRSKENTVLFYDGFGLDLRGWAASFARALSSLDYNVVYVAPQSSKGKIPHIVKEIENGGGNIEYIDMKHSYMEHMRSLGTVFNQYKPKAAFFYTKPNDVSGATVFDAYAGKTKRIQIDLTDHAFWIGTNAFDHVIESRMPGVSNLVYYRGVSFDKIARTDCTPYINRDIVDEQFPFDIENEKYFFSGGSLYKTLGDENLLFYKIAACLLEENLDTKFIYAGEGDNSEIMKLSTRFKDRVFYIHERQDFIRLFENCVFFLNTYPMFGGLMMRYAALAGKSPLTLRHGFDHVGLLNDQEKRGIEFDTIEEIVAEGSRLLKDEKYRQKKAEDMRGACLSAEDFARNVKLIIEKGSTDDYYDIINKIDTNDFRAEYVKRLNPVKLIVNVIPSKKNKALFKYFPLLFFKKGVQKILK